MRHILLTCFYFRRTRLRISKYLSALSSFLPKKKGKEGKNTHIVIIKLDFKGRLENLISRNFCELLSAALVNKLLQASEFPLVSRVDNAVNVSPSGRKAKWRPLHLRRTVRIRFPSTVGGFIWIIHFHTSLNHVIFPAGAKYQG